MSLIFTTKQKLQFLHHAELAGHWYCNNQNTNERPWGGIAESADLGRFVYEYVLHKNLARGMGCLGAGQDHHKAYGLKEQDQL